MTYPPSLLRVFRDDHSVPAVTGAVPAALERGRRAAAPLPIITKIVHFSSGLVPARSPCIIADVPTSIRCTMSKEAERRLDFGLRRNSPPPLLAFNVLLNARILCYHDDLSPHLSPIWRNGWCALRSLEAMSPQRGLKELAAPPTVDLLSSASKRHLPGL